MSDVKIIRALLIAYAPLTAIIAVERIAGGMLRQGVSLPAIAITSLSNIEQRKIADTGTVLMTSRTQVMVHAKSYAEQKALIRLVGLAITGERRTVVGVLVDHIARDIIGPDMSDDDAGIFEQSRDFRVFYHQPLS